MRIALKLVFRTIALLFLVLAFYFIFRLKGLLAVGMLAGLVFTVRVFDCIDARLDKKEAEREEEYDY